MYIPSLLKCAQRVGAAVLIMIVVVQARAADVISFPSELTFGDIETLKRYTSSGHQNELWRIYAFEALKSSRPEEAVRYFTRASRFADKYSQHALSLMYWHGVGVEKDRAIAYAWSDLAAERGYHPLLLIREKMWHELSDFDRRRALPLGISMYEIYGDIVAKPRLEKEMRRAYSQITGSRVGATADRVAVGLPNGIGFMPGAFFSRERWLPDQYWKGEDRAWTGRVIVLPIETVPER